MCDFQDEKLYYMDRIFDATEEFLFDHLNPNDEDMYDGDYFGLLNVQRVLHDFDVLHLRTLN